jgi:ABC-type multidrug transport system fused ATPase/permease subunit
MTGYRPGLDPVLRGISFSVKAGEKIGVCGRTGAGKSSLMVALFRIVEIDAVDGGSISIDDVDIATVGLHALRRALSVIPQSPVMFSGSIRYNLDPFGEHDDATLTTVLARVHLLPHIDSLADGLSHMIADGVGSASTLMTFICLLCSLRMRISRSICNLFTPTRQGANFSQGQRQLICIARALLRNAQILIMDEATSAVDPVTDLLLQRTIRECFGHCTVLTIAHRLETIADADRILLLSNGRVSEFDTPRALMDRKDSDFYALMQEAGDEGRKRFLQIMNGESDFAGAATTTTISSE